MGSGGSQGRRKEGGRDGGREGKREKEKERGGEGRMLRAKNSHVSGQAKVLSLGKEMSGELGVGMGAGWQPGGMLALDVMGPGKTSSI